MPAEDAQYHYNQARKLLAKAENTDIEVLPELIRLAEVHLSIWRTLRDSRGPGYIRPYWQTNEAR